MKHPLDFRQDEAIDAILSYIDSRDDDWQTSCASIMREKSITAAEVDFALWRRSLFVLLTTPFILTSACAIHGIVSRHYGLEAYASILALMVVFLGHFAAIYVRHLLRLQFRPALFLPLQTFIALASYAVLCKVFYAAIPFSSAYPLEAASTLAGLLAWLPALFLIPNVAPRVR